MKRNGCGGRRPDQSLRSKRSVRQNLPGPHLASHVLFCTNTAAGGLSGLGPKRWACPEALLSQALCSAAGKRGGGSWALLQPPPCPLHFLQKATEARRTGILQPWEKLGVPAPPPARLAHSCFAFAQGPPTVPLARAAVEGGSTAPPTRPRPLPQLPFFLWVGFFGFLARRGPSPLLKTGAGENARRPGCQAQGERGGMGGRLHCGEQQVALASKVTAPSSPGPALGLPLLLPACLSQEVKGQAVPRPPHWRFCVRAGRQAKAHPNQCPTRLRLWGKALVGLAAALAGWAMGPQHLEQSRTGKSSHRLGGE